MSNLIPKTGERIVPEHFLQSKEAYLVYLRHLFVYESVKNFIPKNSSVIEVGCGEGYGTKFLSQDVKHIIGLDIDKRVIQYASSRYSSENCSFKLYDGLKIPYDDNLYDAVISFQVIEHVQDDINYLAEIRRIVKADGLCMLTTPNRTSRVKAHQKPWNRFHVREYDPDELEALLRAVFSDVRVWGIWGNNEIQRIEKARIKQAQQFAALDLLNLRRLLPASYETWIVKWLKRILRREHNISDNDDFLNTYRINDYYITKNNVEDSLDLLAICKKF